MFFYEIRTTRKQPGRRPFTRTEYMEALKPGYVGEKVGKLLADRYVRRVTAEPITQAAYVKATRPGQ